MNKKPWLLGSSATVLLGSLLSYAMSYKIFKFAMHRRNDRDATTHNIDRYAAEYRDDISWYHQIPKEIWHLDEKHLDDDKMIASYIPSAQPSQKTVIIAHGFKGNRATMANYAKMFHRMHFNVLLPDNRGQGQSDGKYITFGWMDQIDYQNWIKMLIHKKGADVKILLFGVSMGGAIVSMLSGDKLPKQVKCTISDCGYSSVTAELNYVLGKWFHLPKYPFNEVINLINKVKLGYYMTDVSTVKQLRKCHLPIFIIHGARDKYVPTYMSFQNYQAAAGPKALWIVPYASHGESYWINPQRYQEKIEIFLKHYFD